MFYATTETLLCYKKHRSSHFSNPGSVHEEPHLQSNHAQ